MAVIIITIQDLSRMTKSKRLITIKNYPDAALRINSINGIEMIVRNRKFKQIWAPIDYCIRTPFTEEELEALRDEIRY